MDPQTKLENDYVQNALKFHKTLILAPYVSTGARRLTTGGENEVQNEKILEISKITEMIQDGPR